MGFKIVNSSLWCTAIVQPAGWKLRIYTQADGDFYYWYDYLNLLRVIINVYLDAKGECFVSVNIPTITSKDIIIVKYEMLRDEKLCLAQKHATAPTPEKKQLALAEYHRHKLHYEWYCKNYNILI